MFSVSPTSFSSAARLQKALGALTRGTSGNARRLGLRTGAYLIEAEAKRLCPVGPDREGRPATYRHLRDTVGVRLMEHSSEVTRFAIGTDDPRGEIVEFGTRPHVITPRTQQALWWPGAAHPVGRVQHPGTRPHPWLRPAAENKAPAALKALGDEITFEVRRG